MAQNTKYSLRTKNKIAFFYVDNVEKPTQIFYRESKDKERTKMELMGNEEMKAGDYVGMVIKIKNPKTKKTYLFRPDLFAILLQDEKGNTENYIWEKSYENGQERVHAVMSPVGIGSIYYMASPNSIPIESPVLNIEKVIENPNTPYQVNIPKLGLVNITPDEKTLTIQPIKGKKKVFVEKEF
jgi:hypothetical protein